MVIEKYAGGNPYNLPYILAKDPVVQAIGAKPGDVIKIIRKSRTGHEVVYYRLVVRRWGILRRIDVNKYMVCKKLNYDTWPVVKSMIKELGLARQHIDSYNYFIERGIKEVIEEQKGFTIQTPYGEIRYEIEDVKISEPEVSDFYGNIIPVTPAICRLRGLTYAASVKAVFVRYKNGQREYVKEEVDLGRIPVMLKSKICRLHGKSREELIEMGEDPDDPGGYFIINGSERCIVALEDLASNSILTKIEKTGTTKIYTAKILSVRGSLRTQVVVLLKKAEIMVTIPFIRF